MKPVIHLNGTGKERLTDDYTAALDAIHVAIEKFQAIEFHARDYYPINNDAFNIAQEKRREIAGKLIDVRDYLEDHIIHILNQ